MPLKVVYPRGYLRCGPPTADLAAVTPDLPRAPPPTPGQTLERGTASPSRLSADSVEDTVGFAQLFPEHDYRIVRLLQERGQVVGMTGDGVNGALVLKQSDGGGMRCCIAPTVRVRTAAA